MATHSMSRDSHAGLFIVGLVIAAMIALVAVPAMNHHAQGHGLDAWRAWAFMRNVTPEPDDDESFWTGHNSENSRDYLVAKWPRSPYGHTMWVVVIVGGGGAFLVTCFLCRSRNYVDKIKSECD